ncbi:cleavage and polyadenylation specificity factor subunit 7 isoform X2 [Microcaecilia unicolor]|uniref:Cleavage and polyadenylation specificity factor subunit 7 isoform X2 n=1 Tax=Microcaecilia unicolor TaxID=1415580 RepID=A0A6P7Y1V9_9AMPH|nr:cleavage and polyadenylation specificity factor subunit 7 isoform X2 [Microcaecilia unicolor]
MSEGVDLIDIYADEEFNQDAEFGNAEQVDLYDDVLAVSAQTNNRRTTTETKSTNLLEASPKPNSKSPAILYTYSGLRNKRAAVYVGNFFWWTTDHELAEVIQSVGVSDVLELKFAENRANGQSKGYAEVVVASENSVHKLLERLPKKKLNGEKLDVRLATHQNLTQFEAVARKRIPPRAHSRDSTESADGRGTPTENAVAIPRIEKPPVLPFFNRPSVIGLPRPHLPLPPPVLSTGFNVPPPPPRLHYPHLMPPPPGLPPHMTVPPPGAVPPALHLNPAFFPPPNTAVAPPVDLYNKAMPDNFGKMSRNPYLRAREMEPPVPPMNEVEFEEIMNRNRAISSSAISKAVAGASSGNYGSAIETLLTAIAVIKQSKVSNDERCRVLLTSLKDCLHGIEIKSYSGSGSSSSRKRHRSREKSPSRSREGRRHRDILYSEDRPEDYYERHRERDRERDRHR